MMERPEFERLILKLGGILFPFSILIDSRLTLLLIHLDCACGERTVPGWAERGTTMAFLDVI
jgi:hypothetical protein